MQSKSSLPHHAKPDDAEQFLASLKPVERQLQELAQQQLGSSYFMAKTNAYRKWRSVGTAAPKKS